MDGKKNTNRSGKILIYGTIFGFVGYVAYELYTSKTNYNKLKKQLEDTITITNGMSDSIDNISNYLKTKFALSQH